MNNQQLYLRLSRLRLTQLLDNKTLIAYLGLHMVSKGNVIPLPKALRIIKQSKLDEKIQARKDIPLTNILEALIYVTIMKRELLQYFFDNPDLAIWSDENVGPYFDIMQELSEIYKI